MLTSIMRSLLLLMFLFPNICFSGIEFDGSNSHIVNFPDIAAIDTATQLSACVWVTHDTTTADAMMLQKSNDATDGFLFYRDDVGGVSARTDIYNITIYDSADGDSVRIEGATNSSTTNTWTHVCFTWVGGSATGLRLYVNGAEDANSPVSSANVSAVNAGTNGVLFGLYGTGGDGSKKIDGIIGEVAIWTTALSAQEVLILASSKVKRMPLQIQPSSLVLYAPLDNGVDGVSSNGALASDMSSARNNSTSITGGTWRAERVLTTP